MSIFSSISLNISILLFMLNGSTVGFITFQQLFGFNIGVPLFVGLSLAGSLYAWIAEREGSKNHFLCRFLLASHLLIAATPILFEIYHQTIIDYFFVAVLK